MSRVGVCSGTGQCSSVGSQWYQSDTQFGHGGSPFCLHRGSSSHHGRYKHNLLSTLSGWLTPKFMPWASNSHPCPYTYHRIYLYGSLCALRPIYTLYHVVQNSKVFACSTLTSQGAETSLGPRSLPQPWRAGCFLHWPPLSFLTCLFTSQACV